jgi:uncharacterized protein with von Willebrand factor type A (vWA) domain
LRKFAREGAADQLDLDDTIDKTARNAGLLDIRMVPERHNAIKVLLCLDIGGSMDDHVRICEEMFSAARSEFKHLEYFYFHNFISDICRGRNYESLRNRVRRGQCGALERGAWFCLDQAVAECVSESGLAESRVAGSLGVHAINEADSRNNG